MSHKAAKQRSRPVTRIDINRLVSAVDHLRMALECCKFAEANNAAASIRPALKSTQGALRHAYHVEARQARLFADEVRRTEEARATMQAQL